MTASRIDHAQSNDGVDLQGDVVAGDDVLRGNFHRLLPQRDAHDLIEGAEDQDDARAFGSRQDAARRKTTPRSYSRRILIESGSTAQR